MKCIFCKNDSSESKSCEHIIPESLGNVEHILSPGIVCDKCNNYFSLKIEKKILEQPYFTSLRFRQKIESKKGKYPVEKGVLLNPLSEIELHISKDHVTQVFIKNDEAARKIPSVKSGAFIIPAYDLPEKNNQIISRFLGKLGLEELASRFSFSHELLDELVNDNRLDYLRDFVRYRKPDIIWPYHLRRLYDEDKRFTEEDLDFQMLHEMTLLYTDSLELYIVVCIMGVEYCLNMGGPELDGYEEWLKQNNYKSPLEPEFCPKVNRSDFDEWKKKTRKKILS